MSAKQAYQFDAAGLFAGITEADESPMEPGVFLAPGRSTFTSPPKEIPAGKWPRWNGLTWALVNRPSTADVEQESPVDKLRAFLNANPDVAEMLETGATG